METNRNVTALTLITNANTVNVLGFVLFQAAKHFQSVAAMALIASVFLCNALFALVIFYQIFKHKMEIGDTRRKLVNLSMRLFFSLFFVFYSVVTISKFIETATV